MKIRRLAVTACLWGISTAESWAFFFGPMPMSAPMSPVPPFGLMSPLGTGMMGPSSLVTPILMTAPLALGAVSVLGPALATPWGNPYFSNSYLSPFPGAQGANFFANPYMNSGGGAFPFGGGSPGISPFRPVPPQAAFPYGSPPTRGNPYLQPPAPPPNVNPFLRRQ